jgi:hypothetical protein
LPLLECGETLEWLENGGVRCLQGFPGLRPGGHQEEDMPVSYEIDKEGRMVVVTATGICTLACVLRFREELLADSDFDPSFSQLVDATGMTRAEISPEQVRSLAERSPFSLSSRRALVAGSDLGFGLLRVYEIVRGLRGDTQVQVFRNRAAAMEWLLARDKAA